MAPLPITENASAVALVTFVRAFSQVRHSSSVLAAKNNNELRIPLKGMGCRRERNDSSERTSHEASPRALVNVP